MDKHPQVLLKDVVDLFQASIGCHGQHAVTSGDEVYIQPHVYTSLHTIQMQAAGWKEIDFDQVAAVSGASALFGYEPGEFMPKYAHLSLKPHERIAEATGFGYEWVGFDGIEGAWELIKETVDSGRSAKGWDWENILFAGYQDAAKPEDRKVFAMADGPETYANWFTWTEFTEYVERIQEWGCPQLGRHTQRVETKPAGEVALRVITDLIAWSTDPPEHIAEKYSKATFGLAGIERYAADCANVEEYEDWCPCHDINPQWTVRNSTAVYLRRVAEADVFSQEVGKHLIAASEEYRAAYEDWKKLYELLGHAVPVAERRDRARRLAGSETVMKALVHERAGLAELRSAIDMAEGRTEP
jgi:hypothetical protein